MSDPFANYDSWKLDTPPEYDDDKFYCEECEVECEEKDLENEKCEKCNQDNQES